MMKKRLISTILVLSMLISLLPMNALAALETQPKKETACTCDFQCADGVINMSCKACANEETSCTATKPLENPFKDVKDSDWFYQAAMYAIQNEIFNGTESETFSPDGAMTRAMYVTVLGRIAGIDPMQYTATSFQDVDLGTWYAPYIEWAAQKGIANGTGFGNFSPDLYITREQMATLTLKYFETYQVKYQGKTPLSTQPADFNQISDWAKDAVLKLWQAGLLQGDESGNVNPKRNANRAEAATFCMRTNQTVKTNTTPEKPEPEDPDTDNPGGGGNTGGGNPVVYNTLTFHTNGGAALKNQVLAYGTALTKLPTPYKMNCMFLGWYKNAELTDAVKATDAITKNMTLYAKYSNADGVSEQETAPFASKQNQKADFSISITDAGQSMDVAAIRSAISYSCLTNPEFTDLVISGSNGTFIVSGNGGFPEGSTNKLELLNDALSFTGEDPTADVYHFTIDKKESLELQLNQQIKYLPVSNISNITKNGTDVYDLSIPLASVQAGRSATPTSNTTGTFTYRSLARGAGTLKVGDTVAIYEGTKPDERTLNSSENNYADEDVAYVTITEVNGDQYTYKNADSQDVLFTPDILPVSDKADLDGKADDSSIEVNKSVLTFTDDKYATTGLNATTTIDVGDFIAFYPDGSDPSDVNTPVKGYARITDVRTSGDHYIVDYEVATIDEILAAMDIYDNTDISGEDILGDANVKNLEQSIEKQALESGFAEGAASYLAALALETDGFKDLSGELNLQSYHVEIDDGKSLASGDVQLMASKAKLENLSLKADIRTQLKHFEGLSGLRAALTVSFDVVVPTGENKIVVHVEGTFEEEVRLSLNVRGGAVWKKAWIFPYIADYRMNANIDVYNFTGISVNAIIGTFGKDETPDLDKDDDWDNVAMQLKELIEKAEEGKEAIDGIDTMGTSLSEKYSSMLQNDSDWVELFSVKLFEQNGFVDLLHILCYGVGADFVVSANLNVSIGFDFYYENAKRYTFSLGLFSKTSKSDTIVLVEEKYEFTFYVMGSMGVRAGIRLEVAVGLFSLKLNSIGITAEVGAYVRMWGYFYYHLTWTASQGKSSKATGALLLEIGIYLEIKFRAQAFNGYFEYNPTLYENEWPLWSAGSRENVQSFAYSAAEAPTIEMKKSNYTTVLPDSVFKMSYMDMKDGKMYEKSFDDEKNFTITMTNSAFSYNPTTNEVKVNPGNSVEQKGEMVIAWKSQPLTFSSKTMSRKIALSWEDFTGSFAISFNTNGGDTIKTIVARPDVAIQAPTNPAKQGYVFGGWYSDKELTKAYTVPATMGKIDVVAYAKWNPATNMKYVVEHYQQNLTNAKQYTLIDTEVFQNGVTDSTIQPATKSYVGFTAPAKQNLTILPDGSAVLKYYYTRNFYTLTFARNDDSGNENSVKEYAYGAAISAPKLASVGYEFAGWSPAWPTESENPSPTMPAGDLTYHAQWTPSLDTPFRVEHYTTSLASDSEYTLMGISTETGETNSTVSLANYQREISGFSYVRATVNGEPSATAKISRLGDLVIKFYYNRNKYPVNYVVEGGTNTKEDLPFESLLNRPQAPVRLGYTFDGWYTDNTYTLKYVFGTPMQAKALNLYGRMIPNSDTAYTVEHWVQDVNGTYQRETVADQKSGQTGAKLTLADLKKASLEVPGGIVYQEARIGNTVQTEGTILADGSLLIKLYYKRLDHTLTFKPENGEVNKTITAPYGSAFAAPVFTKQGYVFDGWTPSVPTTMPAQDMTYVANWKAGTNTAYKVEHYQQNAADNGYTKVDTENLIGTTDAVATAQAKSYTNFALNLSAPDTVKTGVIAANGSLVLKLYYDREQFTVTFNANGGELASEDTQMVKHGAAISVSAPTRTGYGFGGWYLEAACTTPFDGTMPTKNLTIYARWTAGEVGYRVEHYVMDTAGNYPTSATQTDNKTGNTGTNLILSSLKNTGLEVTGGTLYQEAQIGGVVQTETMILADGTLRIKLYYARQSHTLTFKPENGEANQTITALYGSAVTAPTVEKQGYVFGGWTPTVPATMPAQDTTYTAQWTAAVYNITYLDQNGAVFTGTMPESYPQTYTYGTGATLPTPTRSGYKFEGFYDNSGCTGTAKISIATDSIGDKTFYAKWSIASYSITYVLNGGNNSPANPSSYNEGTAVALAAATRDGYDFIGWYDNIGLSGTAITSITSSDSGAKTFYAKWQGKSFTIKFDKNNPPETTASGTMSDALVTYDQDGTYTIPSSSYSVSYGRYVQKGWATSADGSKVYDLGQAISHPILFQNGNAASPITLYSYWEPGQFQINYVLGGGDEPGAEIAKTYTYKTGVILYTPTYTGKTFLGWYQNSSFTGSPVTSITATDYGNKTFYAKWEDKTTSVVLNANDTAGNQFTQTMALGADLPTYAKDSTGQNLGDADAANLPNGPILLGWTQNQDGTGTIFTKVPADFASGELVLYAKWIGSESNPYLIDDADTYQSAIIQKATGSAPQIGWKSANAYYKLTANIILPQNVYAKNAFFGTLDGNGKTITVDIQIAEPADAFSTSGALFSQMSGTVKNLTLSGSVSANRVAGIAVSNYGSIIGCTNNATITATTTREMSGLNYASAAGIAFTSAGQITNCTNNGAVSAVYEGAVNTTYYSTVSAAGITTKQTGGKIENCINNGIITSGTDQKARIDNRITYKAAGITTEAISGAMVIGCTNRANVSSFAYRYSGSAGIVYYLSGGSTVENCNNGEQISLNTVVISSKNYDTLNGSTLVSGMVSDILAVPTANYIKGCKNYGVVSGEGKNVLRAGIIAKAASSQPNTTNVPGYVQNCTNKGNAGAEIYSDAPYVHIENCIDSQGRAVNQASTM